MRLHVAGPSLIAATLSDGPIACKQPVLRREVAQPQRND